MHIQFFVPGLLWPGLQTEAPTRGLETPALARLLGVAACELAQGQGGEVALLSAFGLPPASSLAALRRLVAGAPDHLLDSGWLLLEHGFEQGPAVRVMLREAGFSEIATRCDMADRERVTGGQWRAE